MPHQDHVRPASGVGPMLNWLVPREAFGSYSLRKDSRFTAASLARLSLAWAWSEQATLSERLVHAQEATAPGPGDQRQSVTYQAFVKLLRRHSASLLYAVIATLQARLRESLSDAYRVAGFVVFAIDGTRIATPRTASNQAAFEPKRPSRSKKHRTPGTPQVWLTTLWHVGTGLPWGWRTGPSNASERGHLRELLAWLPERSLITADGGYLGYGLCQEILTHGHDFLFRIGGNVRLLKKLGYAREYDNRVYLWPEREACKRQPPIVLRIVVVHNGKAPVYLVTTVLAKSRLSDRRVIELYRKRWGIEVFYRSFKRTFARHKLASASPENALWELNWSLAAFTAATLYAKAQQRAELHRTSVAGVLRVVRRAMRSPVDYLRDELANALIDAYQRNSTKASRDYPFQKSDPPGDKPPRISQATPELIALAKSLRGFTA